MYSDQTVSAQPHRIIWFCLALAGLLMIGLYSHTNGWPFNPHGHFQQTDASAFWAAGRFAIEGHAEQVYDKAANDALFVATFGKDGFHNLPYPYPPQSLLLMWPLGFLSYPLAWVAFVGCSLAIWFSVLRIILKDSFSAAAATIAAGGATETITFGQNGFYTASLLIAGLLVLPRKKNLAGLLFGVLLFKPHLAIALFVALVIWREWQVMFVAMLTTASLTTIATIAFGTQIWHAYVNGSTAFAGTIFGEYQNFIAYRMQSVFAMTVLKEDWKVGLALHTLAALGALLVMSRIKGRDQKIAGVVAASALMSPYIFHYDLTMLTGAAALLLRNSRRPLESGIIAIAAALPAITLYIHLPIALLSAMPLLGIAYLQSVRAENLASNQTAASAGNPGLATSGT